IRAAARRAISSGPVGAGPSRLSRTPRAWQPFAAAAAVAALAFGLLRWLPRDGELAPPVKPQSRESSAPGPALAKQRSSVEADQQRAERDTATPSDSRPSQSFNLNAQSAPDVSRPKSSADATASHLQTPVAPAPSTGLTNEAAPPKTASPTEAPLAAAA